MANPALYVLLSLIVMAIIVVFFIGFYIVFTDDDYSDNSTLTNILIAFVVLSVVHAFVSPYRNLMWLTILLFIINFILLCVVFSIIYKTDVLWWFLPLMIVYLLVLIAGFVMLCIYWSSPKYALDSMLDSYMSFTPTGTP